MHARSRHEAAAAAEQRQQQQQHSTSRTPGAALGTAVEAGKHRGTRRGKVKWRPRRSYFVTPYQKVKLRVRVSPSAYSIRLYSSRHDEERHNHTLEGQQRNVLQGERNGHIHAYMYSFITSPPFLGSYIKIKLLHNTTKTPQCR